ncbi:hypothetical protein GCM10023340_37350 [Nocardioides marinquilinus]|uniref:Glycosyltransferase subfamily 4-like N-terminal domain-containing protein n=1 Tax=Nocardioides marinquilinus TaxID=1210400 RepID=A0ABP9PYB1_9ACTN
MKADPADATTVPREASRPRPLDVVAVPASHPYVRSLIPTGSRPDGGFVVRPDPDPDDPSRVAGARWWPPVALDPDWLGAQDCDLLHVHFGFDDRTPAQLTRLLDVARARGVPVVLTIHDLRNPHHDEPDLLEAQLAVLVPRVDALLTLTDSAAREVATRWGRRAHVVPHPHLVDLPTMRRVRAERAAAPPGGPRVVGLAVKELRRSSDPLRLLPRLEQTVREDGDARLQVTVHHEVRPRTDERARRLIEWLDAAPARGIEVVWHDPWSDDELWQRLAALDVAVLPYRYGTHSGWLEACHDLGTRVLAPSHGHYAAQGADGLYDSDEAGVDLASLDAGLRRLLGLSRAGAPLPGLDADARAAQREDVAAFHARLYDRLVGATRQEQAG